LVEQNKCRHCNPGQNPNYCKQSPGNVFCKWWDWVFDLLYLDNNLFVMCPDGHHSRFVNFV
jgi:hypothetical protein